MNLEDFKHVSESVKKRNPHLYGGRVGAVETCQHKSIVAPSLDGHQKQQGCSTQGVEYRVVIIANLAKVMDDDNLAGACKPLRDAIASTLGIDDGDKRIQWHYHQIIDRHQGVAVKITAIQQMN